LLLFQAHCFAIRLAWLAELVACAEVLLGSASNQQGAESTPPEPLVHSRGNHMQPSSRCRRPFSIRYHCISNACACCRCPGATHAPAAAALVPLLAAPPSATATVTCLHPRLLQRPSGRRHRVCAFLPGRCYDSSGPGGACHPGDGSHQHHVQVGCSESCCCCQAPRTGGLQ
jgi:hypothetical protein